MLVGIVIDRGLLKSVGQRVSEFYPGIAKTVDASRKSGLTLRHPLTMFSGMDWPEWGAWNCYFQPMVDAPNWVEYVLDRPMAAEPGSVFTYNSGGSQVLSAVVGRVARRSAAEFAQREPFDRIVIGTVEWPADPNSVSTGGYGIRMSARDAARFAYLYLNNGAWDGRQVVSRAWIEESTRKQSEGTPGSDATACTGGSSRSPTPGLLGVLRHGLRRAVSLRGAVARPRRGVLPLDARQGGLPADAAARGLHRPGRRAG